ncbi:MAG: hypothetical protein Q9200_007014 [Gallowayella weberi]
MATPSPSADPTLDLYSHTVLPAPTAIDAFSSFSNDPIETDGIPATPTSSFPSPSPSRDDDQTNNNGILNYYFLLLALLIILLGILYLLFARRQRQKIAQRRQNGQRALARDLEHWGGGGGPWGPGRFRMPRTHHGTRQGPRREEGLDERGEAPPPYIPKEPEQTYAGDGAAREIPLQDLSRMDHKPPDYDEGPSSMRGLGTTGMGPVMRGE